MDTNKYLTREQAAARADVKMGTLDKWCRKPGGPRKLKFRQRVLFDRAEFEAWLAGQLYEVQQ